MDASIVFCALVVLVAGRLHFLFRRSFRLKSREYYDMPGFEAKVFPVRVIEHEGRRMVQADLPMP